jgi:hypothetical protein
MSGSLLQCVDNSGIMGHRGSRLRKMPRRENGKEQAMGGPPSALFEPIALRNVSLQSRIVMGSMHTGLECHPERFGELARFYADRARGGVGLIVTGGFAPRFAGRMRDEPSTFDRAEQVPAHRIVTEAVHAAGGRILLQILHAGRYGYHPAIVAPSAIKSPINRDVPRVLLVSIITSRGRSLPAWSIRAPFGRRNSPMRPPGASNALP